MQPKDTSSPHSLTSQQGGEGEKMQAYVAEGGEKMCWLIRNAYTEITTEFTTEDTESTKINRMHRISCC